jgi:hypothetical protein
MNPLQLRKEVPVDHLSAGTSFMLLLLQQAYILKQREDHC